MQTRQFQYRAILEALDRRGVRGIVVGGVCAVAHGAPITTFDLDVVHLRTSENIDRIMVALADLQAFHREPGERRLAPRRSALEGDRRVLVRHEVWRLGLHRRGVRERIFGAVAGHHRTCAWRRSQDLHLESRDVDRGEVRGRTAQGHGHAAGSAADPGGEGRQALRRSGWLSWWSPSGGLVAWRGLSGYIGASKCLGSQGSGFREIHLRVGLAFADCLCRSTQATDFRRTTKSQPSIGFHRIFMNPEP